MKKTRPAFLLTVLAKKEDVKRMAGIIFTETTTTGIRHHETPRMKLDRKFKIAKTKYGPVNVKVCSGPSGILTISPEHDECVKIARARNVPLKTVYEDAKRLIKP